MRNTKLMKREPSAQIISNYPKQLYSGYQTDIPYEFRTNNDYKYIFTVIDHFSKLAQSYLLKDKTAKNIITSLNKFIEFYGKPNEFSSDNGREFINSSIESYSESNNIHLIRSRPYNSKSQRIVGRIHSTIRKALLCKSIENPSNFNLEIALNKVMNTYNNLVHKSTKKTPNEVFYSTSQTLYDEVKSNCIKSFLKNLQYNFK